MSAHFLRSGGGRPADSDRLGSVAGHTAGLPADGAVERRGKPGDISCRRSRCSSIERPQPGPYVLIDDLNIVFIVLNTFVGFTTSIFSATYIGHELQTGRLTPAYLRFYHAMYQVMMFGMNLALVANNIGLMWVAIELATLATVLMVGIYRTREQHSRRRGNISFSAAWESGWRCSAQSSFTWRREPVTGEGYCRPWSGLCWSLPPPETSTRRC